MSWETAWAEGRTGWDAGASPPALTALLKRNLLPPGHAVVPGAGAGYDVISFARHGYDAVGVDIAPTAAGRFGDLLARSGPLAGSARIEVGDYLKDPRPELADVVWDYTFLCALEPEQRASWARRHAETIRPGGQLVTLIFPTHRDANPTGGPPYVLSLELVEELTAGSFELLESRPVPESHPGRAGKELLARRRRR